MKFGLFTCGYQHMALETAFRDAADFGYDYIELWGGRPHAFAPDLLRGEDAEIRRLIQRYHMPVRIYTPEHNAYPYNYMLGTPLQWEDCMAYLTDAMRAACAIGAEYTLISMGHGGNADEAARRQRLLRSLHRLSSAAEDLGQKILLETLTPYESNTCTRCDELAEVLAEINSPALYGMCDVVVPYVQGEDAADYVRRLPHGKMAHLHLIDGDGVSENHLVPGDGVMPLRQMLHDIRAAGYDGTATLELVTNYMSDPTYYAGLALQRAKELL